MRAAGESTSANVLGKSRRFLRVTCRHPPKYASDRLKDNDALVKLALKHGETPF